MLVVRLRRDFLRKTTQQKPHFDVAQRNRLLLSIFFLKIIVLVHILRIYGYMANEVLRREKICYAN